MYLGINKLPIIVKFNNNFKRSGTQQKMETKIIVRLYEIRNETYIYL